MRARIKWVEDVLFVGESGSGHGLVIDGPPEHGGRNLGPRPMELLLLGVGSCSAFDVVHILKKGRHPVADCQVEVRAERAETDPKVFTRIYLHFTVTGKGLSPAAVERAVRLSAEKYCSASIMLGQVAEVQHTFEVVDPGDS
ncbi:MAG: OsmC family protein [Methylohalobius sp.]|nr:OsmC family protein [Methylohalobius sp.]